MNVRFNENVKREIVKKLNSSKNKILNKQAENALVTQLSTKEFINFLKIIFFRKKNLVNSLIKKAINKIPITNKEIENQQNLEFLRKIIEKFNRNYAENKRYITSPYVGNQLRNLNKYLKK